MCARRKRAHDVEGWFWVSRFACADMSKRKFAGCRHTISERASTCASRNGICRHLDALAPISCVHCNNGQHVGLRWQRTRQCAGDRAACTRKYARTQMMGENICICLSRWQAAKSRDKLLAAGYEIDYTHRDGGGIRWCGRLAYNYAAL